MERIKPQIFTDNRNGIIADTHTHSEFSHDSVCPILDMAKAQKEKGTAVFAVTDHCDIEYFETVDVTAIVENSIKASRECNSLIDDVEILSGFEICELFWNSELSKKIISENPCDFVIGSVHAVEYKNLTKPFSAIDFSKLNVTEIQNYLDCYFDDMLKMLYDFPIDVLAHLTVPLRYINGKYGFNIDLKRYEEKITKILRFIIDNNIALEINTSCKGSNYDELLPEEWIIKLYKAMGGELITLASDAHIAENASHSFREAIAILKRSGFNEACYFKNKNIYMYNI